MNCEAIPCAPGVGEAGGVIDQLEEHLHRRFRGRIRFLEVLFDGESLVLQGCTPSFYLKQLIQHAVMEFTGIPIRANAIVVES